MRKTRSCLLGSAALALIAGCSGGEDAASSILEDNSSTRLTSESTSKAWVGTTQDARPCRVHINEEKIFQDGELKKTKTRVGVSNLGDSSNVAFSYTLEDDEYYLGECGAASGIARNVVQSDDREYSIVVLKCESEKARKKSSGEAAITFNDGIPAQARAVLKIEKKSKFGQSWEPEASYNIFCRNLEPDETVLVEPLP